MTRIEAADPDGTSCGEHNTNPSGCGPRNATRLNGLDPEVLGATSARLPERNGERARSAVVTRWLGGLRSRSRLAQGGGSDAGTSISIESDMGAESGVNASAPDPLELLLSGLNSCLVATFVMACTARGIEIDSLEIGTEGSIDPRTVLGLDPRARAGYETLSVTVRVSSPAPPAAVRAAFQSVTSRSPGFASIVNPTQVRSRIVVDSPSRIGDASPGPSGTSPHARPER